MELIEHLHFHRARDNKSLIVQKQSFLYGEMTTDFPVRFEKG